MGGSTLYLILLAQIALAGGVRAAQEAGPDRARPIDHELAADLFEEARGLSAASPWPGSLYGRILFVDPTTRYAVANEPDSTGVLVPTDTEGVFAGILPADVVVANTATAWSGTRWTMLLWPPPAGYYSRRVLLGHEMFHRLGPEIGLPMTNPVNGHLEGAQGRLWVRLELRSLARALAENGSDRRAALSEATAFRARRHALFPEAAEGERALELNEGLSEYTGIRVSLPAEARAGWAVQRIESREAQADDNGLSRSFAYATGAAYGLLLDDAEPGWPASVVRGSDLAAMARRAYGIDTAGARAIVRAGVARYDGVRLERFEREREEANERRQAMNRARYVEGPVLILPVDEEFSYAFDPNAVSTLDDFGQVLTTAEVQGGWGRLDVSGGVLLRRSGGNISAVVVPAPGDPDARPLTGDGWTLRLGEGWQVAPGAREGDFMVTPVP